MLIDRRAFLGSTAVACLQVMRPLETPTDDFEISNSLKTIREKRGVPGLSAAIVRPDRDLRIGSVGVRKVSSPEAFTSSDLVHVGSCTKAMTATMIATLVEAGKLSWTTTLAAIFPESTIHEDYRNVTLSQLLSHRAGLPANGAWWGLGSEKSTTDQRCELLKRVLGRPPHLKPGTKMLYSNVGYAFAALMAETVTKLSWEQLMKERLFIPLEMKTAGFGPPGTIGKLEQPWGHSRVLGSTVAKQRDNAPAMGPAGTVHLSMADWAKFVTLHINGGRRESTPILKAASFRALQTPDDGQDYAKGWVQVERDWADGHALYHNGSNTSWFAVMWLAPKRQIGFLAATNDGSDAARRACDDAVAAMIKMDR
jgi:CubicO group peptidase (beta-lactamase class C family)